MANNNNFEKPLAIIALVVLFCLANVADLITTFFILPAESNPIVNFLPFGVYVLAGIKLAVCVFFARLLIKRSFTNETEFFFYNTVLVFGTILLFIGAGSNAYYALQTTPTQVSPSTGEMVTTVQYVAETTTPAQRATDYAYLSTLFYLVPVIIIWLAFELYNRNKKYFYFKTIQPTGTLMKKSKVKR